MPGQIQGSEAILQALEQDHDIKLILVDREKDTKALRLVCETQNIPLEEGSTNDLWRMSANGHTDGVARGLLPGTRWLRSVRHPTYLPHVQQILKARPRKTPAEKPDLGFSVGSFVRALSN